ncbi:c-type cytochrome biogenesis protein CcsB [Aeromicrobium sp. UC242_57]|uniref:c-type cytochrome biogenesis protein CcsB n=1 Tax=Aeromicrobium sp. UC242_57 TaxID=3374624 RepID=UPI0037A87DD8
MTLENYAQISNYAVASATIVLALAFVAYVAQWGFARGVAPDRELVAAGGGEAPPSAPVERSNMAGGIGLSLSTLAAVILFIGLLTRGLAAERVPWGNMYEFGCAATFAALLVYLLLERVWDIEWAGPFITGVGTVVLGASAMVYVPAGPLVPALHSYWLVIHVFSAIISGAAFLVGAAASVLYLVKSRAERNTPDGERTGFLWRIPSSAKIDQVAYRVHAFAFPIWTFAALISGPIWAQYAWGRYWGWDPKEVWAFITWVVYAGYLHARATAGWKGKAAAIIALIGFATFVFNFVGVNLFVGGMHSYAK